MVDKSEISANGDEVIFSAQYSSFRVWFSFLTAFTFLLTLLIAGACFAIRDGNYLGGGALAFVAACGALFILDAIFFKELLFYGDRVAKVWHLFGQRTISYSNASVSFPQWYMRWISSAHHIFESKENGRPVPLRLPIMYNAFFFPADTWERIDTIVNYLTQDDDNNPKKFRKTKLPKEIITADERS